MVRARLILALLSLVGMAGCGGASPPRELSGLWSASQAACAAGVGVRFKADAIEAVYDHDQQTLFDHPRYQVEGRGNIRIVYDLPRLAGGAYTAGAHGVIVLGRTADGIAPRSHNLIDPMTGAVRVRIADDPAQTALTLEPCGRDAPHETLRGRGA